MKYPHRPHRHDRVRSNNILYVVAVISNPARFTSRYRLYEEFAARLEGIDEVRLVTVEHAYGDRHHEVTMADHPDHVQVRGDTELWHKENLINLGVRRLPHDWKYMAWVDADVEFLNPEWAQETIHQLQHHHVVQLFEDAVDLGPRNNVLKCHVGFARQHQLGKVPLHYMKGGQAYGSPHRPHDGAWWHTGFAWACTRYWYENVGGLLDCAVMGAADHHMCLAMIGKVELSLPQKYRLHPSYAKRVEEWQRRCTQALNLNLGCVEGAILHHYHGPKAARRYVERWGILAKHQFNPDTDITYDAQGLLCLTHAKPGLRDDIRNYFRQRNEDSRDDE